MDDMGKCVTRGLTVAAVYDRRPARIERRRSRGMGILPMRARTARMAVPRCGAAYAARMA